MLSTILNKVKSKSRKNVKIRIKVYRSMRDYRNESFFVKKAEAAREVLSRVGFPEALTTT